MGITRFRTSEELVVPYSLMASERYELLDATGGGSMVALEVGWSGMVGDGMGLFGAGQKLEARLAIFLKFRDGLIVAQRNYLQ